MIQTVLMSYVITFGFGVMFQVRGKRLFYASLGASLGSVVYVLCKDAGWHYFLCLFYTATVFSCYAEWMSRKLKTPVTLFLISTTICFVPGGLMYETMVAIIQGNMNQALALGIEAFASAGALALGIAVTSAVFRVFVSIKNKAILK